jgi:hypothetical protein
MLLSCISSFIPSLPWVHPPSMSEMLSSITMCAGTSEPTSQFEKGLRIFFESLLNVSRRTEFQPQKVWSGAATIEASGHRIPRTTCDAARTCPQDVALASRGGSSQCATKHCMNKLYYLPIIYIHRDVHLVSHFIPLLLTPISTAPQPFERPR